MQLEFRHGGTVMRADGDVVEIFGGIYRQFFTQVAQLCGRSVVALTRFQSGQVTCNGWESRGD